MLSDSAEVIPKQKDFESNPSELTVRFISQKSLSTLADVIYSYKL